MRKKFLSAFMLGLLTLGATSTMTSCKDYDGDISSLKSQIASLEDLVKQKEQTINQSIQNLQNQINQANNDHATKAALAEAKDILEKAIKNESADREKADQELDIAIKKAQGAAEAAQNLANKNKEDIAKIVTDLQNVNTEIGNIKKDVADNAQKIGQLQAALEAQEKAYKEADEAIKTSIANLKKDLEEADKALANDIDNVKNVLIPAIEKEVAALAKKIAAIDEKYDVLTKALAKDLRGLVFRPDLYVDGIEAIEYPYLDAKAMALSTPYTMTRKHSYEATTVSLSNIQDYDVTANAVIYGPTWAVNYHMNPSSANPAYADVKGFAEREVEVVSRVAVGKLGITSPEKFDNGEQAFALNSGILTAGIKIAHPELLADNGPAVITTGSAYPAYGLDNIVALQVNSQVNGRDTLITSDYALLYGEPVIPEAIIWSKQNHRNGTGVINVDEDCPYLTADKTVHVFDTPQEALAEEPSFEIAWDDQTGITISEYISTHYLRDCVTKAKQLPGTWAFGEEKMWGLHYEFETVEYKSSANVTIDSRYCKLNAVNGNIVARNVETTADGGKTTETQDRASIDREPLVRIKLMQGTTVILDGYVLVKIVEKAKEADNKTIEEYATLGWDGTFDNCNGMEWGYTTWDQFSDWVLTQELKMTKAEFDAQYTIDQFAVSSSALTPETKIYNCTVYKDNQGNKFEYPGTTDAVGEIFYREDAEGVNNHGFKLVLSEKDIEYLTHDKSEYPVVVDFYACFNGGVTAAYKKVYVKFTVTLSRNIKQAGIKTKGSSYWYALDGNDEGWDANALNVGYPVNNTYPTMWTSNLMKGFETNVCNLTDNSALAKKFFFVPNNTEITDQHGVTWIVTARSGCNDNWWNSLPCEYGFHDTLHKWPLTGNVDATYSIADATDNVALGKILKECAISYAAPSKTAFDNVNLYAVAKSAYNTQVNYTKIAEMNPANGDIELVREDIVATPAQTPYTLTDHLRNAPLDMILNAVGYAENKANISKQFHTWVGVAANNGCNVAIDLYNTPGENNKTYAIWEASWERPINMNNSKPSVISDAKDNGEYIAIHDLLSFYDWRGPKSGEGDMQGEHKWLWAYYNIHALTVDLDPTHITTDINGGTLGTTKLSDKTNLLTLKAMSGKGILATEVPSGEFLFTIAPFNSATRNATLNAWCELNLDNFGYIFYANNGLNVETFTLRIPIEVCYEWGHFDTYVDVKINRTLGN